MDWIDFALRLPYRLALVIAIIICLVKFRKHRGPAVLAGLALVIALVSNLSAAFIYRKIAELFTEPQIAFQITNLFFSIFAGLSTLILLVAVFTGRRINAIEAGASEEELEFAMMQLNQGSSIQQTQQQLLDRGLSPRIATSITEEFSYKQSHKAGWRNLIIGVVLFVVGAVVTAGSYYLAVESHGSGSYLITYGLLLVGAAQSMRGLIQLAR